MPTRRRRKPRRKPALPESALIENALRRAVAEALLMHKRAGNPVCEWRDGRVHWVQPEDIKDFTGGGRGRSR